MSLSRDADSRSSGKLPPPSPLLFIGRPRREKPRETPTTMRGWREEMVALSLQGHGHGADGDDDRPEKPRRYGVTEMRSPDYSFRPAHHALQEILESIGPFVDGLKFSGGSHSLMGKELIREITDLAHKHEMYVSTGDWAEHLLRQGPSSFKQYVEECKELGFDTIELNAGSLKLPEEAILRLVRLIKSSGLRAKPLFSVKFDTSDIPASGERAFGAYIAPVQQSSGN
ncbi:hypothetical protein ACQ4PT_051381 [Festuca glaucescens]